MTEVQGQSRWKPYAIDWIVMIYSLLMAVMIAILGRPLTEYVGELVFYVSMAVLAGLIVRFLDETACRWHAFLRLLYPAIMFTFFYRATGGHMFLLFDGFLDHQIVAWEQSVLGMEPTLFIDRHLLNTFATEALSLCYFSYYLMLPWMAIALFMRGEHRLTREFLSAAALTFFVSYLLFWLYPAEGPRWFLTQQYLHRIEGPVLRQMVNFVIDNAAVHGGAMPSSHTGVALVVLLFCFRVYHRVGWILLPVVAGLAAGAIWGRFHYLSDVIVGAAIGAAAVWITCRTSQGNTASIRESEPHTILRTQDVS